MAKWGRIYEWKCLLTMERVSRQPRSIPDTFNTTEGAKKETPSSKAVVKNKNKWSREKPKVASMHTTSYKWVTWSLMHILHSQPLLMEIFWEQWTCVIVRLWRVLGHARPQKTTEGRGGGDRLQGNLQSHSSSWMVPCLAMECLITVIRFQKVDHQIRWVAKQRMYHLVASNSSLR